MCKYYFNPFIKNITEWNYTDIAAFQADDIQKYHQSIDSYNPTPLVSLPELASDCGVGEILVKDEAHRLGLKAFKVLGASYAIFRFLKRQWERQTGVHLDDMRLLLEPAAWDIIGRHTFCTATDGNHGRAVAWTARKYYQGAVIYMPGNTVQARIDNIRAEGAEVVVVDGSYDDAVNRVAIDAEENGWQIISDTSYEGYTEIPQWIMAGYTTLFEEIDNNLSPQSLGGIDLVFIQTGVGALAAAAAWYFNSKYDNSRPRLICVEPTEADCLLESIINGCGDIRSSRGTQESIMAGLNCGTPSLVAWPIIRDGFDLFMAIGDEYSKRAMRMLYHPCGKDPQIISGESGAAGLAGLLALLNNHNLAPARQRLRINNQTRVLVINTEGDTDPEGFRRIIEE